MKFNLVRGIIKADDNIEKKDDPFTKLVGHLGRWQLTIFVPIIFVKFSSGWVQLMILFLTPSTNFWCVEFSTNRSIGENSTCYNDCTRYEYDRSVFNNTIVSEWDLICERRWLASFTQMVLQFGILVGSILYGFLSDRLVFNFLLLL